jgi:restriction system protein
MPSTSYWVDVSHDGLHAYRRIAGRDRYVVEAKGAAQKAAWAEKWARMQQREKALFTKEEKKDSASHRSGKATEAIANIDNTLLHTLDRESVFDWEQLKDRSHLSVPPPSQPAKEAHPAEPLEYTSKYAVSLNPFDYLIPSWERKKRETAKRLFGDDLTAWQSATAKIDQRNASVDANHEEQVKKWEFEKQAFKAAQDARNAETDAHRGSYFAKSPDAIIDYCDFVLSNSEYPDSFPRSWQLEYNPETRSYSSNIPCLTRMPCQN